MDAETSMSNQTVMITGCQGFTGQLINTALTNKGYKVAGLVDVDITSLQQLRDACATVQPDYVIHLAAISQTFAKDVQAYYQVNTLGALNVIQALYDEDIIPKKIIMPSSGHVYGAHHEPVTEQVCPRPINHYGCSKLAMEHMLATWFDHFPIIITRPFNYTGATQSDKALIPKIVGSFLRQQQSMNLGDLTTVRDFSDVDFVIDSYIQLMESDFAAGTVNICSGEAVSIEQIVQIMCEHTAQEMDVIEDIQFKRHNDMPYLVGCNQKLLSLIGPQSILSIDKLLHKIYLTLS